MTEPRFLLVGFAAELSLRPLARALAARGCATRVVDLAHEPVTATSFPAGEGPRILISSQHLTMTGAVYDAVARAGGHYRSPQALREITGADLLVYVPHDLGDPLLEFEVASLRTIDLFAAPTDDCWWAAEHVPVVVTGWVGSAFPEPERLGDADLSRGVLFVCAVQWVVNEGGGSFLLRELAQTLASRPAVKLPSWPGLDEVTATLEGEGLEVLDPTLPAPLVIDNTPLVITNAPSSVLTEAAHAGHRPVCVLGEAHRHHFRGHLGAIDVVLTTDDGFHVARSRAGRVRPGHHGFDLEGLLAAIGEQLAARGRLA